MCTRHSCAPPPLQSAVHVLSMALATASSSRRVIHAPSVTALSTVRALCASQLEHEGDEWDVVERPTVPTPEQLVDLSHWEAAQWRSRGRG